jgi:hypothetical protein
MDMSSYRLPNGSSEDPSKKRKFSLQQLHDVVNGLIAEYGTPDFRGWYSKLVTTFGPQIILDLQGRCRDANFPGKVFSARAKELIDAYEARQRFEEGESKDNE